MQLNRQFIQTSAIYLVMIVFVGVVFPALLKLSPLWLYQVVFTSGIVVFIRVKIYRDIQSSLVQINRALTRYSEKDVPPDLISAISEKSLHNIKLLEQHFFSLLENYQETLGHKEALIKQLNQSKQMTQMILDISHSIINLEDPQVFYEEILEHAVAVIEGATHGSISKLNESNQFEFLALKGYDESIKDVRLDLSKTFLWVKTNGEMNTPVIIDDIFEFNREYLTDPKYTQFNSNMPDDIRTTISAPIHIDGKVFGMINVDSHKDRVFTKRDMNLLDYFSKQIAIAIQNRLLVDQAVTLSRYDFLTIAYNRPFFEAQMQDVVKRSRRYNEIFSLAIIDINHFKQINEEHGIKRGDQVLIDFAKLVKSAVRDSDTLARIGGDGFALLFLNTTAPQAEAKLQQILSQAENTLGQNAPFKIQFSYGVSEFPKEGADYEELLRRSDEKVILAKRKKD